jgi:hypothetical protein
VRNLACPAYGTGHALLQLEDEFKSGQTPHLVIYAWIPDHLRRNYRRRSWLTDMATRVPLFELKGEKAVSVGLGDANDAVDDGDPTLEEREWTVMLSLLQSMRTLCHENRTGFVAVILPMPPEWFGPWKQRNRRLVSHCRDLEIDCCDLSDEIEQVAPNDYFPRDGHPNARWHSIVARMISDRIDVEGGKVKTLGRSPVTMPVPKSPPSGLDR